MGMVLPLKASKRIFRRRAEQGPAECEIVIFPGVRIERHDADADLDLGHRLLDSVGGGDFDDIGGNNRPRRTS